MQPSKSPPEPKVRKFVVATQTSARFLAQEVREILHLGEIHAVGVFGNEIIICMVHPNTSLPDYICRKLEAGGATEILELFGEEPNRHRAALPLIQPESNP